MAEIPKSTLDQLDKLNPWRGKGGSSVLSNAELSMAWQQAAILGWYAGAADGMGVMVDQYKKLHDADNTIRSESSPPAGSPGGMEKGRAKRGVRGSNRGRKD